MNKRDIELEMIWLLYRINEYAPTNLQEWDVVLDHIYDLLHDYTMAGGECPEARE